MRWGVGLRASLRQRYFVIASLLYIGLGIIILVRTVLAHVLPLAVLGIVFIALGAVRLRDYYNREALSR